ncbi:MAG: SGNH/GDSL hydrolase family protein [Deltaproteobacteria bacterium]|nr:SGNH/GDSL hydrolase family protein [Deltaproteobacteria bacterium]
MKTFFSVLLVGFLVFPAAAEGRSTPLRVLFIGNSLTFYNEMPSMVERLAEAAEGQRVETKMIVRGGETFQRHVERDDEDAPLRVLEKGGWDVVVLQENGRAAAAREVDSLPPARRLVEAARRGGAKPIFYMTWSYLHRPESFAQIQRTYYLLGSELGVPVAPVGEAWRLAREEVPELELFDPDGVHPNTAGSYLAALVLYSVLFEKDLGTNPHQLSPIGESAASIPPEKARQLQLLARDAVKIYPQPASP